MVNSKLMMRLDASSFLALTGVRSKSTQGLQSSFSRIALISIVGILCITTTTASGVDDDQYKKILQKSSGDLTSAEQAAKELAEQAAKEFAEELRKRNVTRSRGQSFKHDIRWKAAPQSDKWMHKDYELKSGERKEKHVEEEQSDAVVEYETAEALLEAQEAEYEISAKEQNEKFMATNTEKNVICIGCAIKLKVKIKKSETIHVRVRGRKSKQETQDDTVARKTSTTGRVTEIDTTTWKDGSMKLIVMVTWDDNSKQSAFFPMFKVEKIPEGSVRRRLQRLLNTTGRI